MEFKIQSPLEASGYDAGNTPEEKDPTPPAAAAAAPYYAAPAPAFDPFLQSGDGLPEAAASGGSSGQADPAEQAEAAPLYYAPPSPLDAPPSIGAVTAATISATPFFKPPSAAPATEFKPATAADLEPPPPLAIARTPRSFGRYRIERTIGRGGMGEVLEAYDPASNNRVAIKILDDAAHEDNELMRRFEREAQAVMRLSHQNIAKVFEFNTDEPTRPYIVMEFVEGKPLDRLIHEEGELAFSRALDIAIQTARGLEAAHRRSIIHRDIKPGNLIVTAKGQVKIIDFGLAKNKFDNTMLTGTGMVVGTPRYISPEQGLGRSVDHRSDIYSLGATLYEMITRQTPFDGDTAMAIMLKHINAPLTAPYQLNPRCPTDINTIIVRMMAKDAGARYQDYEELIRDLETARITRLAKESRISAGIERDEELTTGDMVAIGGQTIHSAMTAREDVITPDPAARSSYLTEGLISIDMKELPPIEEEEAPSGMRWVVVALVSLAVLGAAAAIAFRPVEDEKGQRKSWIARSISGWMQGRATPDEPKPEELARRDEEAIATTRGRMEAVILRVIDYRRKQRGGEVPRVRDLRREGFLTADESTDGWGHDLLISSSSGGQLISKGRDGIENTDDDMIFTLSGQVLKLPPAQRAEDFIANKK